MIQIEAVHESNQRRDLPPFRSGDTVRVHVNITEGDKQRIQVFEGVVIRRRGAGRSATFTVRKLSYGVGVERIFPIESPAVTKVEIKSRGHVRRSRLYYLRGLTGKKARLRSKVRDLSGLISEAEAEGDAGTADDAARAAEEAVSAADEASAVEDAAAAEEAPAAESDEAAAADDDAKKDAE
jgi:large subunit ribosomal protein L19